MFIAPLLFALTTTAAASDLEVHGHRGARGRFPENTLPAFQHAIEAGADWLELDVAITSDGVAIIHHDTETNADLCLGLPKNERRIFKLKWSDLQDADCGTLVHKKFAQQKAVPGTRIPRLEDFLRWLKNHPHPRASKVRVNIEAKVSDGKTHPPEKFVEIIFEAVRKTGMEKRVMHQSFHRKYLETARAKHPSALLAYLTKEWSKDTLAWILKSQIQIAAPHWELLTPERVQELHSRSIRVVPWTVNQREDWKKVISMGVDGIITDYPQELIESIQAK